MSVKANIFLAKLLILFSIVLIGWGTFLSFNGSSVLHPVDDVTVIAGTEKNTISITPIETVEGGSSVTEGDSTNVNTDNITPPSNSNVNNNTNVGSQEVFVPSVPSHTEGNNNANSAGNIDNADNINNTPTTTVADTNLLLRENIENIYGITVKYGSETLGYSVGGMTTEAILDDAVNQKALNELNKVLSLYPTGFFSEVKNKGYPLTFYLVKRFSKSNVTGVTDTAYKRAVISIATDYDLSDTFHHEVYHYMEKYIFSTGFRFTSWNTLNPAGFKYGTIDNKFSYSNTFSDDSFFVNNYAQTDEYEDRASTFEYMMKSSKASCLNYGKTVWLKARTMSEQIDYFFDSVSPSVTEYWERYVY